MFENVAWRGTGQLQADLFPSLSPRIIRPLPQGITPMSVFRLRLFANNGVNDVA